MTNVGTLVRNGYAVIYRLTSSLNMLGELEYKLTVSENTVANSRHWETLTASTLHFYLEGGEIGCPGQEHGVKHSDFITD